MKLDFRHNTEAKSSESNFKYFTKYRPLFIRFPYYVIDRTPSCKLVKASCTFMYCLYTTRAATTLLRINSSDA